MRAPRASPGGRLDAQLGALISGRALSVGFPERPFDWAASVNWPPKELVSVASAVALLEASKLSSMKGPGIAWPISWVSSLRKTFSE